MPKRDTKHEAQRVANHLASMPGLARAAVPTAVAREILLSTDGQLMLRGEMYEIVVKSLGAGVQSVTTKRQDTTP